MNKRHLLKLSLLSPLLGFLPGLIKNQISSQDFNNTIKLAKEINAREKELDELSVRTESILKLIDDWKIQENRDRLIKLSENYFSV